MTSAVLVKPLSFPLFSNLPPELRNQIWNHALPTTDGPVLYFFGEDNWDFSPTVTVSQANVDAGTQATCKLDFEAKHKPANRVRIVVPLRDVCHEARRVALAWAEKRGIEERFNEERQCHIFTRPIDPTYDTLCFGRKEWNLFCQVPFNTLHPSQIEALHDYPNLEISIDLSFTHVAISEELFRTEAHTLHDTLSLFKSLPFLILVVDEQAGKKMADSSKLGYTINRWELGNSLGRAFLRNSGTVSFDLKGIRYSSRTLVPEVKDDTVMDLGQPGEKLGAEQVLYFDMRRVLRTAKRSRFPS
ncbi:hypothetical protein G7046_g5740 [Stylonectria norvegica]|nr:hypothetical protein G7046_g5740 [Stylonectria norvegica]